MVSKEAVFHFHDWTILGGGFKPFFIFTPHINDSIWLLFFSLKPLTRICFCSWVHLCQSCSLKIQLLETSFSLVVFHGYALVKSVWVCVSWCLFWKQGRVWTGIERRVCKVCNPKSMESWSIGCSNWSCNCNISSLYIMVGVHNTNLYNYSQIHTYNGEINASLC